MKHRKEVGAFVYRFSKKGRLKLLLVSNRKQTRWILPKGQTEASLADKKVALKEAHEEAGIIGRVDKRLLPKVAYYQSSSGPVALHVYPMQIEKKLKDWPEQSFRRRAMVDINTALLMVRKQALLELIRNFSSDILALEHAGQS